MRARFALMFFGLCLALGCSNTPAANDTGTGGGNDAGNATDSGADVGTAPGGDAGTDAATTEDTGVDAASDVDAATLACAMDFAGCTTLEDHTADTSPVVVTITSGTSGFHYTPNCIRINAGQMVTLPGAVSHPLTGASCSATTTPILASSATTGGTFTFSAAGNYGYFCAVHGSDTGAGMAGLVVVQ